MNRHPDLPSEIPLYTVDLGGKDLTFPGGEDFWAQVHEVTDAGDFATALDQALENHPVPRVWLLLARDGTGGSERSRRSRLRPDSLVNASRPFWCSIATIGPVP